MKILLDYYRLYFFVVALPGCQHVVRVKEEEGACRFDDFFILSLSVLLEDLLNGKIIGWIFMFMA